MQQRGGGQGQNANSYSLPSKYLKTTLSEVVQLSDSADPHDGKFLTVLRLTKESPSTSKNPVRLTIVLFYPISFFSAQCSASTF